jgi:uncharacterized protein YutE (UPF0331/DUF86 family)
MYFVDRSKIEQTLLYMEEILGEIGRHNFSSFMEKLALERMAHVFIESLFDVGNMMIDGFIMRDPGSYDDIIDILIDEKVLPQADEADYKAVIRLRKLLVNNYITIDHNLLNKDFIGKKTTLKQFSHHIRKYLDNELGVMHAFSNETQA